MWRDKPRIRAIKYASPGWLDLALNLDVALQVAKVVCTFAGTAVFLAKSYAAAMKVLYSVKTEREKSRLAYLKLTIEQDAMLMKHCNAHAKLLGFKSVKALNEQTGNSEVTLRLLLAHHRRLRELGKYVEDGKVILPPNNDEES